MSKPTSDCRATERKHLWPMVRLGDVCEIEFGTRVRRKDSRGGDYPVYGGGGATFCWDTYNREDRCIVSRFAMSEECVRFVKGKFFLNDSGLSVKSGAQNLSQTYLDWVLYSKQLDIYALGRGAAQKNLDVEQFADMLFPLPPLPVQREIVARLERELAAVEKMKKGFEALAETAKAEFKAELKEVFEAQGQALASGQGQLGWRKLGEICEKIGSGATPLGGKKTYQEKGISLIRSQNVIDFSFSFSGLAHINETQAAQLDSVSVFDGDVLVNITGDSVARVCIVDNRCLPARVNQHVAIIRLSHSANVLNRYLEACLVAMKDELLKESVKGSTRKALTKDYLVNLEVPLPSLPAQCEIVARLSAAKARAEKLEAKAQEGVAVCETMRKAVLKEAFE